MTAVNYQKLVLVGAALIGIATLFVIMLYGRV
jgi:hypothetical protein